MDFQVDCNRFSLKEGWFESILFDSIDADHSCFDRKIPVVFVFGHGRCRCNMHIGRLAVGANCEGNYALLAIDIVHFFRELRLYGVHKYGRCNSVSNVILPGGVWVGLRLMRLCCIT